MAETCEVVALGREDVCLEFKKVLTAYDSMKLTEAAEALDDQIRSPSAGAVLPALQAVRALVPLIEAGRLGDVSSALKAGLAGPDQPLGAALSRLAAGDAARGECARTTSRAHAPQHAASRRRARSARTS